jgi:preprotein translocase subunit SecY
MFFLRLIAGMWRDSDIERVYRIYFSDPYSWQYSLLFASMILIFTFFYTAITINSNDIADNLKAKWWVCSWCEARQTNCGIYRYSFIKNYFTGCAIPCGIAVLPAFAVKAGVGQNFAQFLRRYVSFDSVGVVLDTLQQIESYLLMRHYEGMMKSGRVKGRSQFAAA